MAVSEEFREQWLECQEEYGKNIEAGDIPVLALDRIDESVSLPAVKFTAPFNPNIDNQFDSYVHVPMATFKKPIDDLAAEVSAATSGLEEVKSAAVQATARANTAAGDANTAAGRADASREAIEQNEDIRQQQEQTRQQQESAREIRATQDHTLAGQDHVTATADHTTATADHATASQDHQQYLSDTARSSQDHATATTDHQASVAATTAATNVNADLTGMTVTITNRQGVSTSVNIGFEILEEHVYPSIEAMNADAANVRAGQFCMIATTDPTSPDNAQLWSRNSSAATSEHPFTFLSDLDQASSAAFADWLDNYKPVIEADHSRAEADHTQAGSDHSRAETDHSRAETDHATASADHTQAGNDHETALTDHSTSASDHSRAETDHSRSETDHTQAGSDHSRAETDHQTASADHTQAGSDHSRAETDHQTASADHAQAGSDHSRSDADHSTAVQDHTDSEAATDNANTEANRAKGYNDHPWEIGDDGFIYVWDEQTQAMVRTEKMIIDFSDLTPEQQAAMIQEFLSRLTFDETPTEGSSNPVTSRGIKTALDQKQDTLTFASDALCASAASEIVFA